MKTAATPIAQAVASAMRTGTLNVEDTWVSRRHRYFYMAVPKAASSKIKMVLQQLEGYPLPADPFGIHARDVPNFPFVAKLSAFTPDEIEEIITSPDWLRFALVRNPYARLYSAYKNKIADLGSPYVGVRDRIRTLAARSASGVASASITFGDFVRYVATEPDQQRDGHWRSQVGILCGDLIPYQILGRVETFARDFGAILRRLGAADGLVRTLTEVVGSSAPGPAGETYNSALAEQVYALYQADFDLLGYSPDSWQQLS